MKSLPHTDHCLNCGHSFDAPPSYCPSCGQRVRATPMPIRDFFGDFVHDYFTVDARFFRSIGLLFFKPGTLTVRFNEGKRTSYIAPFRFYIFVSVVYFTLLAISTKNESWDFLAGQKRDAKASLARVDSLMADSALLADPAALLAAYKEVRSGVALDSLALDSLHQVDWANVEWPQEGKADKWFFAQKKRIENNPERFKQAVFKSGSIGVFFLLPVFGFLLMLFHYSRCKFYINHLVFSVHFHTFVFIMFSLYLALSRLNSAYTGWLWTLIFLFYFFIVVRHVVLSPSSSTGKTIASWLILALFALPTFPFLFDSGDGAGIAMVLFIISAYFTFSLIKAYSQSFNKAALKSIFIIPAYGIVLLLAFVVVILGGLFLT